MYDWYYTYVEYGVRSREQFAAGAWEQRTARLLPGSLGLAPQAWLRLRRAYSRSCAGPADERAAAERADSGRATSTGVKVSWRRSPSSTSARSFCSRNAFAASAFSMSDSTRPALRGPPRDERPRATAAADSSTSARCWPTCRGRRGR